MWSMRTMRWLSTMPWPMPSLALTYSAAIKQIHAGSTARRIISMICGTIGGMITLTTTASVDAPSEYALTIVFLGTARATNEMPSVSVGEMPNAIRAILKPSPVTPNTTMNSAIIAVGGILATAVTIGEHIAWMVDNTPIAMPSAPEIAMPS